MLVQTTSEIPFREKEILLLHLVEHREHQFVGRIVAQSLRSCQELLGCVEKGQKSFLGKAPKVLTFFCLQEEHLKHHVYYDQYQSLLIESLLSELSLADNFAVDSYLRT